MKTKVLILNYYWPPSGGPSVQRWLSFSNHFQNAGIQTYIITVDENFATYPFLDESLNKEVHPETKVIKTQTKEFFWIYKKFLGRGTVPSAGFVTDHKPGFRKLLGRFIRGNFFIPDGRKSWNKVLIPTAIDLIKKEQIDIVISAGPPHSTHLAALKIKKEIPNIVWIADFHDAWTDIWFYKKLMHTPLAAWIDKKLELSVLEGADKVLTVGKFLLDKLADKTNNKSKDKFHLISMGYEEKLFDSFKLKKEKGEINLFTIPTFLYTGTINSEYEPWAVFDALSNLKTQHPNQPFRILFVGKIEEGIINYLNESNLKSNFELMPYSPHHEVVKMMFQAKVLFLCSPKTESENIIIPGKLYEYMASGTPILNLGNTSTNTAYIINETQSGKNFDRHNTSQIQEFLKEHLLEETSPNFFYGNQSAISNYGRKYESGMIL